jgi:hypothetical protein
VNRACSPASVWLCRCCSCAPGGAGAAGGDELRVCSAQGRQL